MTDVFGEVADLYDEVRPGYPVEIAAAILAYHGGAPAQVLEIGAGTGKGTEVLTQLGTPLVTCVEPDPRMASVLRAKFPSVQVHIGTLAEWTSPAGGVPMIACAMAWHWLDEATRNQQVHDSLAPGGTLAVFGHKYGYVDSAQALAIDAAFGSVDPTVSERAERWFHDDIVDSGLFTNVRAEVASRQLELPRHRYLQLVRTFSPFRMRSPDLQMTLLEVLGSTLDSFGGSVVLDLRTTLVLARRPI